MSAPHRIAVIGAGPAGVSAAVEVARLGFEPLLFDASGSAGGLVEDAFEVRNIPGSPMTGREVAGSLSNLLELWGIRVERRSITSLECGLRGVVLRDSTGGVTQAPAVVAATGTEAVTPSIEGLPGSFGAGVYPSARALLAGSPEGPACVIGGGDAAFDQARLLASHGRAATVVCRAVRPKAPTWLVRAALEAGVGLLAGTVVEQAESCRGGFILRLGEPGRTQRRARASGARGFLEAGAVLFAIGRRPVLPDISGECAHGRLAVAGDATGRAERYVPAAMADGCLAARRLLG